MNGQKEKFINFIVDDLVKNTEIYPKRKEINFPFPTHLFYYDIVALKIKGVDYIRHFYPHLPSYLFSKYGVIDSEVEEIYHRLISRLYKHIRK